MAIAGLFLLAQFMVVLAVAVPLPLALSGFLATIAAVLIVTAPLLIELGIWLILLLRIPETRSLNRRRAELVVCRAID